MKLYQLKEFMKTPVHIAIDTGSTIQIRDANDQLVCSAPSYTKEIANRIIACLNKFEGMETGDIESMPFTVSQVVSACCASQTQVTSAQELLVIFEVASKSEPDWAELREHVGKLAARRTTH